MKSLEERLSLWEVHHYGTSWVKGYVPENWKHLHYAITVFYPITLPVLRDMAAGSGPTKTYFAQYRMLNNLINETSLKIALYLEGEGYEAVPIPASQTVSDRPEIRGVFSHRLAATRSGCGWIGKSGMFIHRQLGPAIRLGTVLTDKKLPVGEPVTRSLCGSCTLCVEHCPAMAIEGVLWETGMERNQLYDAIACSDYMKEAYMDIGRGSVCGICMSVCPYNRLHRKNEKEERP